MSWGDALVRSVVASAHSLVDAAGFTESVRLERWSGQDDTSKPTYASALTIKCIVERKSRMVKVRGGDEVLSKATISVLKPIKKLSPVVSGRTEPIDVRDLITLADGTSGPILDVDGGLTDPETGRGYVQVVYLG